jgi:hypothetical protein
MVMAKFQATFLGSTYAVEYPDALEGKIAEMLRRKYRYPRTKPNPDYRASEPVSDRNPAVIDNDEDVGLFIVRSMVGELVEQARSALHQEQAARLTAELDEQLRSAFRGITVHKQA